jgi:hypothetical protein
MLKRYFIVGDKLMCFIPRTASTSLLTLIEEKYYPRLKHIDNVTLHFKIPSVIDDGKRELVAVIRNPVERFLSGCARKKWTIEYGIEELKKDSPDFHIRAQYTFLSEKRETKFFKFPDQIDEIANYLGLPTPVPKLNVSSSKPIPTDEQLAWLTEYYKKDFDLLNRI